MIEKINKAKGEMMHPHELVDKINEIIEHLNEREIIRLHRNEALAEMAKKMKAI